MRTLNCYTISRMHIIVIAHNIRSTHNVGSIFRTCEGFGVQKLLLSGYTPYPTVDKDDRLPHISSKLTSQIQKTALGAESIVPFRHITELHAELAGIKAQGFRVVALEQHPNSIKVHDYIATDKICLVLGEEVEGVNDALLAECDDIIEIDMSGKKESFNVSVAAGIALYALTTGKP
jgi:23S rRNA (guanosine2251-2'-O)-methyltransferase